MLPSHTASLAMASLVSFARIDTPKWSMWGVGPALLLRNLSGITEGLRLPFHYENRSRRLFSPNGASMTSTEDIVIVNANIRTVDKRDAVAEAAIIRDGRFVAVGTEAQVRAAATAGAQMMNVGGRTVIPGLIDPHNHLSIAAFAPDSVDFSTTSHWTLDEVLKAIEEHCKTIPAGQWVRGMRFNMLQIHEKRGPARTELDEVAPNNPFFLIDASCHRGWANSRALAEVGIDAHTPQPWGGQHREGQRWRTDGNHDRNSYESAAQRILE